MPPDGTYTPAGTHFLPAPNVSPVNPLTPPIPLLVEASSLLLSSVCN